MFRMISVAAALTSLSCTAFAAGSPSWLKTPLQKPLDQVTIGITEFDAGADGYVSTYQDAIRAYAKTLGINIILLDARVIR